MIRFSVPGAPAPGGSKRAFANPKTGKIVVLDDAKNNRGWRERVSLFAREAMGPAPPLDGPLAMRLIFVVSRPKGHYGTGRNAAKLRPWAETARPTVKPDVTKLVRAAEDAMTGIVWRDDAQVVMQQAEKRYGENAGLFVLVERLPAKE